MTYTSKKWSPLYYGNIPMTNTNKLKLLDLFSGIGGFSLAFEQTGFVETIAFCEKEPFCQKVLNKHWHNAKIYDDIRKLNGKEIQTDIVTGGFPCQPFSVAGKRRGTDDDRYLWDETLRVVAEPKPRWFVGENVFGLINIDNGKVLQQIQKDLEREGFKVQCFVLPANGVGAWHERKRIWIIGHNLSNSMHNGLYRKKISSTKPSSDWQKEWLSFGAYSHVPNTNGGECTWCGSTTRVCKCKQHRLVRHKKEDGEKVRCETERCCEQIVSNTDGKRLQGCCVQSELETIERQISSKRSSKEQHSWWEIEQQLCGVPHGVSTELDPFRKQRVMALGNSIVPQVAFEIAKSIIVTELDYEDTKEI